MRSLGFTTIGRRSVSNVPSQALAMMNGPFIIASACEGTSLTLRRPMVVNPSDRIEQMYLAAFARPPSDQETTAALAFIDQQSQRYGSRSQDDVRAWADLCHV